MNEENISLKSHILMEETDMLHKSYNSNLELCEDPGSKQQSGGSRMKRSSHCEGSPQEVTETGS